MFTELPLGTLVEFINAEQVKSGEDDAMKLYKIERKYQSELRAELSEEIIQFALEEVIKV